MVDLRKIFRQDEFIRELMEKGNIWVAGIIGFLGSFSDSIISMYSRYESGQTLPNEVQRLFTKDLGLSLLFLFGTITLMYLLSLLLKGKNSYKRFFTAMGWGGLYGIIMAICPYVMASIGDSILPGIGAPMPRNLIIVAFGLLGFAAAGISIVYSVKVIMISFNFSAVKSTAIWLLIFLPCFFIWSEAGKLTDEEKKLAGLDKPKASVSEPAANQQSRHQNVGQ